MASHSLTTSAVSGQLKTARAIPPAVVPDTKREPAVSTQHPLAKLIIDRYKPCQTMAPKKLNTPESLLEVSPDARLELLRADLKNN